jgi:hypothetical protein
MHDRRGRLINLTVLVVALSAPVGLLDGPAWWLGVAALMAATAIAVRASAERSWHGLPLAPAALPMLAAFTTAGLVHLAGDGVLWALGLACGGGLVAATLLAEQRLAGPADDRRARLERQVVPLAIVLAFGAFLAAAGAVAGGLAGTRGEAVDVTEGALTASGLVLLALADAAIAAALGYRLAALRTTSLPEALRIAGTYAVVSGVAAALLRVLELPRLFGPAVLAGVFYLWSAYRDASAAQRRTSTWLFEYGLLAAALVLVVGWNLLLH